MDTDAIKAFLIHHFEKMVFGVIIVVSVVLLYFGWQLPNFLNQHQPDSLTAEATQVKSEIDVNHNDAIIPEREPTFDIMEETKKQYTAVEPSAYKLERTWEGKSYEDIIRREDPVLIAPRALRMVPVATAIAVRGSTSDPAAYDLAMLEPAEPVERVEQKPKREPRRSRRGRGDEMGMDMEMEMMGGGEEMEMMDMEAEMMGEMGGSMGGTRKFNAKFDFGARPSVTDDKRNPEPAVGWFIAGTAVVPHKELYESYRAALGDADQYDPRRDTPFYYGLEIQRADVTNKSVDQLTDDDWSTKKEFPWDRLYYTKFAAQRWSGFAPEIVPADYRDDALTTWIPPVLLDDYDYFATHPLIPMKSQDELKRLASNADEEVEINDFTLEDMGDEDFALVAPGSSPSAGMGMMDDMMGMDMDMEMDMEMDGMMMGMGMAMMGRGLDEDPVDYKLIRFYDFSGFRTSPVPGRKYVYRVRFSVNDPNFPFLQTLQPKTSSLAPDVAQRVQQLMAEAARSQSRKGLFERWSDWSEPSEPVSLPTLEHVYMGEVEGGSVSTWNVAGKPVEYRRDSPKAKIIATQYDLNLGTRVPLNLEVTEGTVLSAKAETTDVVDPITLEVKKLPEPELVSGTTIVDIDGGTDLDITDELKSPGLMLLYDEAGNLKVTTDIEDQEYYRIYNYSEEKGL